MPLKRPDKLLHGAWPWNDLWRIVLFKGAHSTLHAWRHFTSKCQWKFHFAVCPGSVSQNLSSVTKDSFCYKLLKSLLLIGFHQTCHWFLLFVTEKRLYEMPPRCTNCLTIDTDLSGLLNLTAWIDFSRSPDAPSELYGVDPTPGAIGGLQDLRSPAGDYQQAEGPRMIKVSKEFKKR